MKRLFALTALTFFSVTSFANADLAFHRQIPVCQSALLSLLDQPIDQSVTKTLIGKDGDADCELEISFYNPGGQTANVSVEVKNSTLMPFNHWIDVDSSCATTKDSVKGSNSFRYSNMLYKNFSTSLEIKKLDNQGTVQVDYAQERSPKVSCIGKLQ